MTTSLFRRSLKMTLWGSNPAMPWSKRVANRRVVHRLNMTLDAAAAYEQVNMLQLKKWGWKENRSLL